MFQYTLPESLQKSRIIIILNFSVHSPGWFQSWYRTGAFPCTRSAFQVNFWSFWQKTSIFFFRPDLIGEEYEGLHEVLVYSIQKSDMDLRKVLFQNIVLSGGSTLFKGFGDRLLSEVKKLAPKDIKIRISAPQERLYSTWIGGSILASLDTFKKMWVSKREYDEEGLRAIHRKTF